MNISVLTVNVKHINFSVLKYLFISCAILICRDKYELSISMFISLKKCKHSLCSVIKTLLCLFVHTDTATVAQPMMQIWGGTLSLSDQWQMEEVFRKPLKTIFFTLWFVFG